MDQKTFTVSELTAIIQVLLEDSIGFVMVTGEVSNYKHHQSGHRYFTLKDEKAQISCVMWKQIPLKFQLKDGAKVTVHGKLTVYPPRGNYQIECFSISELGLGDLFIKFEELKKKLQEKGYFDTSRKKPIPAFPLKIGVSTSPSGAGFQDIITTIKRRLPLCTIYFRPTLVQGDGSAEDIVKAVNELDKLNLDVIIIGRGGGSIEDLWSYNTEIVADAIFNAKTPIISAVGHETDFTIADFVADFRAATPTASAELVTQITIERLYQIINDSYNAILNSINFNVHQRKSIIDNFESVSGYKRFPDKIAKLIQLIDDYQTRLDNNISKHLKKHKEKAEYLYNILKSFHPLQPLNKGFALLKHDNNTINVDESLGNYIEIDIIRKNEIANAHILSVKPTIKQK
jgi:exodeoxyribonuclease VII large subunit